MVTLEQQAMALVVALVKLRDNPERAGCWRCGRMVHVQLHHGAGRSAAAKYDVETCVFLCLDCHTWVTGHPTAWEGELATKDPAMLARSLKIRHGWKKKEPMAEVFAGLREKKEREHG